MSDHITETVHSDWKFCIDKIDGDGFIIQASIDGPGGQIADVTCENILHDDKDKWNEVAESTGRLLAAAPDLLAFARAYIADLEAKLIALGWKSAEQYFEKCNADEPYPLARAAIAKATLEDGNWIAEYSQAQDWADKGNAEFSVRAANNHDAMLEVLGKVLSLYDCMDRNSPEFKEHHDRVVWLFNQGQVYEAESQVETWLAQNRDQFNKIAEEVRSVIAKATEKP